MSVLLFLLLARVAAAGARPAFLHDEAVKNELYDAAYTVAKYFGKGDGARLSAMSDWAPIEASVTHETDGTGQETADVYTIRVSFDETRKEWLCDAVLANNASEVKRVIVAAYDDESVDDVVCEYDGRYRFTPMELAATVNFPDAIQALFSWGGADITRWKPLVLAASHGNREAVCMLLQLGADPNAVSEQGSSAIVFAAVGCYQEVVELLAESGAATDAAKDMWLRSCVPAPFVDVSSDGGFTSEYPYPSDYSTWGQEWSEAAAAAAAAT